METEELRPEDHIKDLQQQLAQRDEMILNLYEQLKRVEEAGMTYAIQRQADVDLYKHRAEKNGNDILYEIKADLETIKSKLAG